MTPRARYVVSRPVADLAAYAARYWMEPALREDGTAWPIAGGTGPHRDTRQEAEADAREAVAAMGRANGLTGAQGKLL